MLDLQNAEIFRAALDSLEAGVCMVDQNRKISYWNDAAERITGYLRQDVLGRFCGEILLIKFHENKAAICEHVCPLVDAMRDGHIRESRVYLHHKSGYAVPVTLRAAPIRDHRGRVVGAAESFVKRPSVPRARPDSGLSVGHGLDATTQLPDYSFTESHLLERIKFAAQHSISFGLVCIQLENLDQLTATHGLDATEAILNVVAHSLRNGLGPLDFVGRWSDDQFLAIVTNCAPPNLQSTADRLKRLAESSEIVWWGDQLSVLALVGGTIVNPGESVESLLQRTGSALKQAATEHGSFASVVDTAPTS
jgi:PAS domain S-box-containing protein/diguanylate cyclase (GGDEF)-like protein